MKRVATILGVAAVGVAGALFSLPQEQGFPHERHAGLFPTCEGCHAGVLEDEAPVSVTPERCANCHDGERLKTVEWSAPELEPSNLEFSHATHVPVFEMFDLDPRECERCHGEPDAETRMAVVRAPPAPCFECHEGEAPEHYAAEIDCGMCHLPLAQAVELPESRIAAFPKPPDHTAEGFLFAHGERATEEDAACEICHTRDSCERCHIDAADVPAIAGLSEDSRVASLVAEMPGEWPEPESHRQEDWIRAHAEAATEEIAECASCHARSSCASCHGEGRPQIAQRLPEAPETGPTGVLIAAAEAMAVGHDETFFDRHGTAAAIGEPECSTCHQEQECVSCHDGVDRPGFHPLAFVVNHGAEAFANRTECEACHSREAFCRDCHTSVKIASEIGRSGVTAFHDAQPDWLLAHGQAARQNLESCVSCHEERSCLRCHSARSGWRVSPHGPDFDPADVADKSTQSCGTCHFDLPEGIEP